MASTKILVAYYSRAGFNYVSGSIKSLPVGNTEVAANFLVALTGADRYSITTVKNYPVDYTETTKVAQDELRSQARPALVGVPQNWDDYDTLVVGYPNWWGTMPMPVYTFLEAYNWAGKTILPYCTHEGSGLGRSESEVRKLCPQATVLKGLSIQGGSVKGSEAALRSWLVQSQILK